MQSKNSTYTHKNAILSEIKVVVLGVAGVGKSSVTLRFVNGTFSSEYNPTLQDTFRKQFVLDDVAGVLEILDTAGQEEYQVMQDHWIREGKGYLIVFALDMKESLDEVQKILKRIERVKDTKDFPAIIVANKCDLSSERKVSHDQIQKICDPMQFRCMETSAKKDINCSEVFMELVRDIRKREKATEPLNEKKQSKWERFVKSCQLI